ncbi:hypothetical protein QMK19_25785 [Streptomyces sp. H10-C2]|uniref:hypothetical protein n=1 Tax=unclassified Streptomyces TaxID=2593676 RepID=UPI0024BBCD4C|nr:MULTISPECIES: hypothetical protein [unclassified Streptomyces]MDJ0346046.1 hypothetical protein [Streptomyces sp. PH10-H1]MDJ0372974.1 hypothetical protein [Streptomyces sp. H10-C2]
MAGEPIPGLKGPWAFVLIAVVVVIIAVIAVVPLIIDVRRATAWRERLTDDLIGQAATSSEVRELLRDLREPRGVRGLTRSIIAVLILALISFALAVAMLSSGGDSGDLRKTIVTSLMTVLATVAGFYFGSLGAQNSADDAVRRANRTRARPADPAGPQTGDDVRPPAPEPPPAAGSEATPEPPKEPEPPKTPVPGPRETP